jgi:hypothetical protein
VPYSGEYQAGADTAAGMPKELTDLIDRCAAATQQAILFGWDAIGEAGREGYRRYIGEAWTRRGRRKRSTLAAFQLTDPTTGFGVGHRH